MDVLMWNREPVGGPFTLIDHDAGRARDADFRGQLMLIYFGFTFCSDVCPIDLQSMRRRVDQLGPAGGVRAAAVHHRRSREGHGPRSSRTTSRCSIRG